MGRRSINEIILDNYLQEMIEKSCNEFNTTEPVTKWDGLKLNVNTTEVATNCSQLSENIGQLKQNENKIANNKYQ